MGGSIFLCPQAGRSVNGKEECYELMDGVTSKEVLVGGDFMAILIVIWMVLERFIEVLGLDK